MRIALTFTIALALAAASAPASAATTPMAQGDMMTMMMRHMASITVEGRGQVEYTPDVAHVTLGVNGEAPSAAAAAADISGRANAVIAALKTLGIPTGDITTTGFSLFYREPTDTVKAAFVASENISLKTSVDKVGQAIDAGLHAGANQTYGLNFDTSQRDALYKQAVDRAVRQARDMALTAASAAGVKLGGVVSIDVPAESATPGFAPMALMRVAGGTAPPVAAGTGTMSTTVTVRFSIAPPAGMTHP